MNVDLKAVRNSIAYDAESGAFTYLTRRAVRPAGSVNKVNGYVEVGVLGKKMYGHRLAWLMAYGSLPDGQIDHINGNRSDNRLANLRVANASLNGQNRRTPNSNNTSGFLGVTFCTYTKRWLAQITSERQRKNLGRFDTPELAYAAYLNAKRAVHAGCTL